MRNKLMDMIHKRRMNLVELAIQNYRPDTQEMVEEIIKDNWKTDDEMLKHFGIFK